MARLGLAALVSSAGLSGWASRASAEDAAVDIAPEVAAIAALNADPAFGEYLSSQCITCHSSTGGGRIPPLAGLPADYMIGALLEYRLDIRDNAVMKAVALGLADEDIAALATYFEQQESQ